MNRKQARSLIIPAVAAGLFVGSFIYNGEWSRAEWHNHPLFRASEMVALTAILGLWARNRYARTGQ